MIADPPVALNFRSLARLNKTGGEDKVTTGWHVIELLLWGEAGDRAATDFVAGEANDRRRDYLAAVAQLLVNDLGVLVAAWAPDANNYRAAVEAMDRRNAIGRAFNGMTVLVGYEIPLRRIGAGLFPANANFQQSPFSDTSAADNRFAFEGARNVYYGSGFDALLAGIDPGLAAEVDAAFDRAGVAIAALDDPYSRFLAPPAGSPSGRPARRPFVRSRTSDASFARPETGSACLSSSPGSDARTPRPRPSPTPGQRTSRSGPSGPGPEARARPWRDPC